MLWTEIIMMIISSEMFMEEENKALSAKNKA